MNTRHTLLKPQESKTRAAGERSTIRKSKARTLSPAILPLFVILTTGTALLSCSRRTVPVGSSHADSVRIVRQVEYRERLRDTVVYLHLPSESRETVRRDSSLLETSAARSLARIEPDGSLFHSLENKLVRFPAKVQIRDMERILRNDTVSVRETVREIPVRMPPSRWQNFWIRTGQIAAGAIFLTALVAVVRKK